MWNIHLEMARCNWMFGASRSKRLASLYCHGKVGKSHNDDRDILSFSTSGNSWQCLETLQCATKVGLQDSGKGHTCYQTLFHA